MKTKKKITKKGGVTKKKLIIYGASSKSSALITPPPPNDNANDSSITIPICTPEEIELKGYDKSTVGKGGFGVVTLCRRTDNPKECFSYKRIDYDNLPNKQKKMNETYILNEIHVLYELQKHCKSGFFYCILSACKTEETDTTGSYYINLDYLEGYINLNEYIQKIKKNYDSKDEEQFLKDKQQYLDKKINSEEFIQKLDNYIQKIKINKYDYVIEKIQICDQLLRGLESLHEHNVYHLDIKPDNIMIYTGKEPLQIKYIDFGLSCIYSVDNSFCYAEKGTSKYMCPLMYEYKPKPEPKPKPKPEPKLDFKTKNTLEKIDRFALGITFYNLLMENDISKDIYFDNHKINLRDAKGSSHAYEVNNSYVYKDIYESEDFINSFNLNTDKTVQYPDIYTNMNYEVYLIKTIKDVNKFCQNHEHKYETMYDLLNYKPVKIYTGEDLNPHPVGV